MTPMPTEYRKKRVIVRCNECRQESITPFHILRLKCRAKEAPCGGSYNTVKIAEAVEATVDEEAAAEAAAAATAAAAAAAAATAEELSEEEMRVLLVTLYAAMNGMDE